MLAYENDVSSRVQIDFEAVRYGGWSRTPIYDPEPATCELTLEGKSFDLCSKDPARVLDEMRRHLWNSHNSEMQDQASVEMAEDFAEAAE